MPSTSTITLRHIAAEAKTTTATVSMALRDSPEISQTRKNEIRQIAERLGYRRNPYVSTLMKHVRQGKIPTEKATVAIVIGHPRQQARKASVFVARRLEGMERRLAERGYRSEVFWYDDPDCPPPRLNKILLSRGIRGIILAFFNRHSIEVDLDLSQFASATQDDFSYGPPIHRAVEDYFANTTLIMENLWTCGYRRIGMAFQHKHVPSAHHRIKAAHHYFLSTQNPDQPIIPHLITKDWNSDNLLHWYHQYQPDAILTFDWGNLPLWLEADGVRVPEQTGIAVLNRCPSSPEFSGIDPEPERLGATVADLVLEQLENNETGIPPNTKVITIASPWVVGKTTCLLNG